jgi:hypothetical protein
MLGGHLTIAKHIRRLKNTMLLTTTKKTYTKDENSKNLEINYDALPSPLIDSNVSLK